MDITDTVQMPVLIHENNQQILSQKKRMTNEIELHQSSSIKKLNIFQFES